MIMIIEQNIRCIRDDSLYQYCYFITALYFWWSVMHQLSIWYRYPRGTLF